MPHDTSRPWFVRRPFGERKIVIWRRIQVPLIGWPWWRIIFFAVGVTLLSWGLS